MEGGHGVVGLGIHGPVVRTVDDIGMPYTWRWDDGWHIKGGQDECGGVLEGWVEGWGKGVMKKNEEKKSFIFALYVV